MQDDEPIDAADQAAFDEDVQQAREALVRYVLETASNRIGPGHFKLSEDLAKLLGSNVAYVVERELVSLRSLVEQATAAGTESAKTAIEQGTPGIASATAASIRTELTATTGAIRTNLTTLSDQVGALGQSLRNLEANFQRPPPMPDLQPLSSKLQGLDNKAETLLQGMTAAAQKLANLTATAASTGQAVSGLTAATSRIDKSVISLVNRKPPKEDREREDDRVPWRVRLTNAVATIRFHLTPGRIVATLIIVVTTLIAMWFVVPDKDPGKPVLKPGAVTASGSPAKPQPTLLEKGWGDFVKDNGLGGHSVTLDCDVTPELCGYQQMAGRTAPIQTRMAIARDAVNHLSQRYNCGPPPRVASNLNQTELAAFRVFITCVSRDSKPLEVPPPSDQLLMAGDTAADQTNLANALLPWLIQRQAKP